MPYDLQRVDEGMAAVSNMLRGLVRSASVSRSAFPALGPASQQGVAALGRRQPPVLQVPVGANRNFSSVASGLAASRLSTGSGNVFPCLAAASNGRVVLLGTSSVASGARGMATSKRTKRTWYGMRVSDDPTAPSVVRRKPTTPSLRHTAMVDKTYLWRGRPVKSLTFGLRKKAGRNNTGRITVWHRGGGNKRKYRMIDFRRANLHSEGVRYTVVERIEYDPNRSALIALLRHCKADATEEEKAKSALSYIVCPRGIVVGSELQASRSQGLDVLPGKHAICLGSHSWLALVYCDMTPSCVCSQEMQCLFASSRQAPSCTTSSFTRVVPALKLPRCDVRG